MFGYVYRITNKLNNKIYIGQCSKEPEESKNYFGSGRIISHVLKRDGKKNFIKQILITCSSQEELDAYEELFIELYSSTDKQFGYNILNGSSFKNGGSPMKIPEIAKKVGEANKGNVWSEDRKRFHSDFVKEFYKNNTHPMTGKTHSEESKIKMKSADRSNWSLSESGREILSKKSKGENNPMYGKKWSDEQKLEHSLKVKGLKHTEEQRKAKSERMKGLRVGENNPNFGKPNSEAQKLLISRSNKKIRCFDENGKYLETYKCAKYLAEKLGITKAEVFRVIETGENYKGFYYSFETVLCKKI